MALDPDRNILLEDEAMETTARRSVGLGEGSPTALVLLGVTEDSLGKSLPTPLAAVGVLN
uniref:Uncharacterized protein n=1 Tax=Desertifilum tharense IPPAS B-1220 TaxID=1781255 RepID=A0ACD5GU44_9CYAN